MFPNENAREIHACGTDDLAFSELAAPVEFVRRLLSQMHDGLCVTDLHGTCVLVNRALCDMTGFSASDLMVAGAPCPYWPGADVDMILERLRLGNTTPLEASFQRKNGVRFPVLVRPGLVHDGRGHSVAWSCAISDLTETKRAAAAQIASEQRWRAIAENPFDFVAIIDRNYTYRYMNHTLPELRMSDVIGKTKPFDFSAPEFHAEMRRAYELAFQTGRAGSYEIYVPEYDRWFSTSVGAIHSDGEIRELSLLSRDVTKIKAGERARSRSERRLTLALESVNDGFVELNLRTGSHSYSARTYQMLGYAEGDPHLSTWVDGLSDRVHPEEQESVVAMLGAALEQQTPFNRELRLRVNDGSYRWFQLRGRALTEDDEERFVAFLTDVTERHQAEEQRRKLAAERQQAQRLETIGTLAGGIAHDFNNMLTPIMSALEIVPRALPEQHAAQSLLKAALQAALRARQLTQQILTFARRGEARLTPINLIELVRDELRHEVEAADTPIALVLPAQIPDVLGDPSQLQQIITNLLRNSRQAMRGRIGHLTLRLDHIEVEQAEASIKPGAYARITVSDQGVGMSPAVQARALEPFFTTKPPGQGSGLGLAVVHGIVARHGGHLRVRSESGMGTTFEVYLPEIAATRLATFSPETDRQPASMPAQIVCVDDEPTVLEVTKRALELANHRVQTTTRPTEALRWIEASLSDPSTLIDLIITDYRMPQLSGLELAQRVRALRPELPVILVTGYAEGLPQLDNPPGVTALLQKPFRISELTHCVERCLAESRCAPVPR